MTELPASLVELARRYGVATEYNDWTGRHTTTASSTLIAVLDALGVPAATENERTASLAAHDRDYWARSLPPTIVGRSGVASSFWVHVSHGDPAGLWIRLEDGSVRTGLRQLENNRAPYDLDGRLVGEATFELPGDLPLGYHQLHLQVGASDISTLVIVSPASMGLPARLGPSRAWGLATQLYSVRSEQSWGVGDLTDLEDLAVWSAAEHQADFVLINPLHAAEPVPPMEPSPYLPSSRRFANPVYLRLERIPEYAVASPGQRERIDKIRSQLHTDIGEATQIDRDRSWDAKRLALKIVFSVPRTPGREASLAAYRRGEGPGLERYAAWAALAEEHGADFTQWPAELQDPQSPAVAAFAATHAATIDFHCWLQWLMEEQLSGTQQAALRAGMALGVMHDLAVGVSPRGVDAWSLQDSYAKNVSVGCPPDPFNQQGQVWNQPPWRPDRLAATAYAPFREMVSTILRHAGGLRVDHVIGLFRLWWVPRGAHPTQGTYVRYDHEAMVGILALEAHRAGAVVVGEDLGTVEPWVRDYLRERGILGTSILWFEFDWDGDGRPLPP